MTTKGERNDVELDGREDIGTSGTELWQSTPAPTWGFDGSPDTPLTLEEIKKREHWLHIDSVRDMVPFWRRGVEAAERGQVLRMEEFLDNLSQNPWGTPADQWSYAYSPCGWDSARAESRDSWRIEIDSPWAQADGPEWGTSLRADGIALSHPERVDGNRDGAGRKAAKKSVHWNVTTTKRSTDDDAYAFVETFARQRAADDERRRKMHLFFEMSTHDKLKKIQEIIQHLQNTHIV